MGWKSKTAEHADLEEEKDEGEKKKKRKSKLNEIVCAKRMFNQRAKRKLAITWRGEKRKALHVVQLEAACAEGERSPVRVFCVFGSGVTCHYTSGRHLVHLQINKRVAASINKQKPFFHSFCFWTSRIYVGGVKNLCQGAFFFCLFAYRGNMKRRRQACAGVRQADKQRSAKVHSPLAPSQKDVWSGAKQLILSLWLEASFAATDFPWQVHFKRRWNAAQPGPARPNGGDDGQADALFFTSDGTTDGGRGGGRATQGRGGPGLSLFFCCFVCLFFGKLKQSNVPHARYQQVHKGGKSKECLCVIGNCELWFNANDSFSSFFLIFWPSNDQQKALTKKTEKIKIKARLQSAKSLFGFLTGSN